MGLPAFARMHAASARTETRTEATTLARILASEVDQHAIDLLLRVVLHPVRRVREVNDARVKSSHELKAGDALAIRVGDFEWQIVVSALSDKRGPAEQARKLYQETEASRAELARTEVPLLYLHGADDGCIGADTVEARRPFFPPSTRVVVLDGVGHFIHL